MSAVGWPDAYSIKQRKEPRRGSSRETRRFEGRCGQGCIAITGAQEGDRAAGGSYAVAKAVKPGNCVYFVGDGKFMKIGFTANLATRMKQLQTGAAGRLRLLACVHGATRSVEKLLHDRLRRHRVRGEWFECEGDAMRVLRAAKAGLPLCSPDAIEYAAALPNGAAKYVRVRDASPGLEFKTALRTGAPLELPCSLKGTPFERRFAALNVLRRAKSLERKEKGKVYAELRCILQGREWDGGPEGVLVWRPS